MTNQTIIQRCEAAGLRMTEQRRVIARVLQASDDHPDVEELYARASKADASISIATVYRTVKLFEESGILDRLEFGDGRARYEDAERDHHDHLIDLTTGRVIEFVDLTLKSCKNVSPPNSATLCAVINWNFTASRKKKNEPPARVRHPARDRLNGFVDGRVRHRR